MPIVEDLIAANRAYAAGFLAPPSTPARGLAVVACMDVRLDLYGALGLRLGEAHLLRNAGGVPTEDVLRSLAVSQHALGTRTIVLLHHTDCGMRDRGEDRVRAAIVAETGADPGWTAPPFDSAEATMRRSLAQVRECGWLPYRDDVHGFVFDAATGLLAEIG